MQADAMKDAIKRVNTAIAAIKAGEMIVVVDDDDRENEGDLIMAASLATPEQVAFIIRHTSGILCTPLTQEHAKRLKLDPMVARNDAPLATAFTVSVDVRHGLTTGISAEERCNTVRALANPNIGADDFVRPGHVFPLISKPGGVLMRSGHTEAATDLCRLAGLDEVGLISELVNDNGSVKRGPEVAAFAKEHKLIMCSVADLIAYRQSKEELVEEIEVFTVNTAVGQAKAHVFATPFDPVQHVAISFGDVESADNVLVRLHQENVLNDVFRDGSSIEGILKKLKTAPSGVFVYLREGSAGVPGAYAGRRDADKTGTESAREQEWREVGLGAQILKKMGVSRIRLLASKERHYVGLSGFGIEIIETELI